MSRQQTLPLGIAVMLVIFFLVGCGGGTPNPAAEAPAATSEPGQAATSTPEPPTPTSELPTDTPIPPTPTLEPSTPTPEPPTPTPTSAPPTPTPMPASNLSEGTALTLGGLEADISSVEEAATLPGPNLQAQSGMKFVVVKLKIKEFQGEFNVENIVLETVAGEQYAVTGGMSISADGTEITLGFEVPQDEELDTLNLNYK